MAEACIVITTAASRDEADRIAGYLVEHRLAACVNLVDRVQSVYRWQSVVERAEEVLLLIKTEREQVQGVEEAVRAMHSYAIPEFLMLTPSGGSQAYLDWIYGAVG